MEEDAESARGSTQRAETDTEIATPGSSPLNVVPTAPIYQPVVRESSLYDDAASAPANNSPTTFIPQLVTLASSRNKPVAHGESRYGYLVPTMLATLLLTCVILLSVLISLRVSGREREVRRDNSGNKSILCVSEEKTINLPINRSQQCDQCEQICLQRDLTRQGRPPECPLYWISIHNKCYFFSEFKKTFSLSDDDCANRNSSLASVKEETIWRLVAITGKEFWVGLTKDAIYGGFWSSTWTDGGMKTVIERAGNCVKLGSRLTLEKCNTELNYICEKDSA